MSLSAGDRRAAVLGHPIGHSLSPVLHRAAYAALGLTGWTYEALDVDEAGLPRFFDDLVGPWAGLSLTMPLKRAVRPLLVAQSELAAQIGAVNTVTFAQRGPIGDNTDVHGIVAALREGGADPLEGGAVVLGGGATAASALAALRELGCVDPVVLVRSPQRCADLLAAADRLGVAPRLEVLGADGIGELPPADVVISTLPPGAGDALAADVAGLASRDPRTGPRVLLDVVYVPWPTQLATAWTARGGRVVSGLSMLLHQAAAQVGLMTGLVAPVEAMRAAAERVARSL